ncbi:MAG: sensor histidine kinase [Janthinobacterium lividum]
MQEANVDSTASARYCAAAAAFAVPAAPPALLLLPAPPRPKIARLAELDASVDAAGGIDLDIDDRVAAAVRFAEIDAAHLERARISRELHDGVGPHLTALRLALGRATRWLPADAPAACSEALALAERTLGDLAAATQDLIGTWRPVALESAFLCTLCDWVEDFGRRTGIATHFSGDAEPRFRHLSAAAETAILRIVQEALNNAAKHAGALNVDVELHYNRRFLLLSVRDDGRGLVPRERRRAASGGMGLSTMRERCDSFGGSLQVRSPRNGGVEIVASLPWQAILNPQTAARRHALHTVAA